MRTQNKLPFYLYIDRFLFEPCCDYCTNIAVRVKNPGDIKCCFNHFDEGSADTWTPFGSSSVPLNTTAWEYSHLYKSPFQWLWVKLGFKEKGKL